MVYDPETMFVLGGNKRLICLQKLGFKEIPDTWVRSAAELTEEEKKRFIIADNVGFGEWDWELLKEDYEIPELEEWGIEVPANEKTLEAEEDGFEMPEEIKTDIVLGDLISIGPHRLLCGDSTDSEQVAKLMNGEKADMVFTDPPYGINYSGGRVQVVNKKNYGKILNDELQNSKLGDLIQNIFLFNKNKADIYICVSPIKLKPFLDFIENNGREINAIIVWDKKNIGLGYMAYRRQCEFILFIKGGNFKMGDISDSDLWSISKDNTKDYLHGNQKPIAVPNRAINNSIKNGNLILDLFLGSGSTMVASHQLNRKCYGMELDPKYCDVIIRRMLNFDNSLKIKRNGKDETEKWLKKIEQ